MATIVDYYVTDEIVHAFTRRAGTSSAPACVRVPCSYRDLHEMTRRFRHDLQMQEEPGDAQALYDVLVAPLYDAGIVQSGEALAIAPHRCLHSIPFCALSLAGAHLMERHSITYAPSSTLMSILGSTADISGGCLVVKHSCESDPSDVRESFSREARNVAAATNAIVLADDDATIENIASAVEGRKVIHFTCHGMFDPDDARQSGLLLAGKDGGDTLCTLETIRELRLDADLVVLAACETGLSDRHPGDELIGLLRAFTLAGARSVLATLWPVHTVSTEVVVNRFYAGLLAGETPSEALCAAQRHVRGMTASVLLEETGEIADDDDEHPFAHPYFWAPFVLIGGVQ